MISQIIEVISAFGFHRNNIMIIERNIIRNIAPLVLSIQGDSKVTVNVNKKQMLEVLFPFKFLYRRQ